MQFNNTNDFMINREYIYYSVYQDLGYLAVKNKSKLLSEPYLDILRHSVSIFFFILQLCDIEN
jgi:hypothetical protein